MQPTRQLRPAYARRHSEITGAVIMVGTTGEAITEAAAPLETDPVEATPEGPLAEAVAADGLFTLAWPPCLPGVRADLSRNELFVWD